MNAKCSELFQKIRAHLFANRHRPSAPRFVVSEHGEGFDLTNDSDDDLPREDFSNAKKFLANADEQKLADDLEKKTMAVSDAKNAKEKAASELALGDAWKAARGELLLSPLDERIAYSLPKISDDEPSDSPRQKEQTAFHDAFTFPGCPGYLRRRANGESIGFSDSVINRELESRDELRHASHWWNEAAKTLPSSPLAKHALFRSLTAMSKIAAYSDYAFARMQETGGENSLRKNSQRIPEFVGSETCSMAEISIVEKE